jgi:hypothetical protein
MSEPDRGDDAEQLMLLLIALGQLCQLFDPAHGEIEVQATMTVAQAHGAYRELLRLLSGEGPYHEPVATLRPLDP